MALLSFEEKYQAIVSKDPSYEGLFITAVKTTRIFCRPVCTARKPKPENVIFYDTPADALKNGFRPCLVCKPMEHAESIPSEIEKLLKELSYGEGKRISDYMLRDQGLDPTYIRRWFQKHYHISFHAYQRMTRINSAYRKITGGEFITGSAFDSGYENLSTFHENFKTLFGTAPTRAHDKKVITMSRFTTVLGPMFACATENGLCLLEFTDRKMLKTEFADLQKSLNAVILPGENKHLENAENQIQEYFAGIRKTFSVSLDTPGTTFQQKVWEALKEIPYGSTCSYKDQAIRINMANAIRAVASANGHNRISIIIPCHRVIGENGHLTGYGGGLTRKRFLIELERKNS